MDAMSIDYSLLFPTCCSRGRQCHPSVAMEIELVAGPTIAGYRGLYLPQAGTGSSIRWSVAAACPTPTRRFARSRPSVTASMDRLHGSPVRFYAMHHASLLKVYRAIEGVAGSTLSFHSG